MGGGDPLPPGSGASRGGAKKGLLIGGGALAAGAVGVAAWAAVGFFSTGAQPAEALPDTTLAYASVDLDPSGGQKIEALQTLNKFPAFKDELGLDTDDDILESLVEKVLENAPCDNLDYEDDFEPWIGSRAAVAAVLTGDSEPTPVVVLQVTDADDADESLEDVNACGGGDDSFAWNVEGDWALLAENDEILDEVVEATAKGTLADDADFNRWTGEAGDSGIVTMYAGPAAGEFLAENGDIFGSPFGGADVSCSFGSSSGGAVTYSEDDPFADDDPFDDFYDEPCSDPLGGAGAELPDETKQMFADFKGAAAIIRFSDGAIEAEIAGDGSLAAAGWLGGGQAGDAVGSLPADTAAAFSVGFGEDWVQGLMDYYAPYLGAGEDVDSMIEQFEDETGLAFPEDIEALFGETATLAVSSDFDPETVFESPDGSDIPAGAKIDGDADEIQRVLDILLRQIPADAELLGIDSEGDIVAIGPNADYREELLQDGELGDDEVFKDVVREADKASTVFFVNLNALEDAILESIGDDEDFAENFTPLSGFGATGWIDDEVGHSVMRITTD